MPYHVFARVEGFLSPLGDYNVETEEEVLKNYCIPYCEGKPITIGGAVIERKKIIRFVIFLSDLSSYELVREAPDNIQRMKSRGREFEAIRINASAIDISSDIMRKASNSIGGNIRSSEASSAQPSTINISSSTITNSPITGVMDHSNVIITVDKPDIENWLYKITEELEKNNVQNEELKDAIDTLITALQAPKPSGFIIKSAVEVIKTIGFNLVSSAVWQYLMTHPPV